MLNGIHPAFDIGRFLKSDDIAFRLRAKKVYKLVAAMCESIDLRTVAGGKDKDLVQALGSGPFENSSVLVICDGKLPANGSIGFFIVDTGYKEIVDVLEIMMIHVLFVNNHGAKVISAFRIIGGGLSFQCHFKVDFHHVVHAHSFVKEFAERVCAYFCSSI